MIANKIWIFTNACMNKVKKKYYAARRKMIHDEYMNSDIMQKELAKKWGVSQNLISQEIKKHKIDIGEYDINDPIIEHGYYKAKPTPQIKRILKAREHQNTFDFE
jgi:predicted DNA-binding protein YlxM (UPF0122 family)